MEPAMTMSKAEQKRLALAEDVCYTLLLAMQFDIIPARTLLQEERDFIAEPMQKWANLAVGP